MKTEKSVSFAAKVLCTGGDIIYLVRGTQGGRNYWAYLQVDKPQLEAFIRRVGGAITLQDFGKILFWGQGKKIPQSTRDVLKHTYGITLSREDA